MANSTFEKILLKDDRIACLTPQVKYAVEKGGQNVTSQPFKAISQTISSHVYNVTVPSLETIISREVLWQSTVTLQIKGTNKPTGQYLVNYGVTDALAPFPLHHLVTQMTTTINNNTVSLNVQDTLPLVLRLLDPEELAKYESMTPTTLDFLANYADAVQPMDYQLDIATDAGTANNNRPVLYTIPASNTQEQVPANLAIDNAGNLSGALRGTRTTTFISHNNNVLSADYNRLAGTSYYHKPRGTWKIQAMYALDSTAPGGRRKPLPKDTTVFVTFKVTEPLMISPFVFGAPEGKQGFYGIQTMNFQMNIAPTADRSWRSANTVTDTVSPAFIKTATIESFTDSQLIFTFLTPHASDLLEPRNVVPFYELPVYRTSNLVDVPAVSTALQADGTFLEPPSKTLYSSSIQLYSIPDKLVICVRKPPATLTCNDTDSYLTIKGIRINWNNQAGLLSTFTPEQLYRASVQSGLSNLTWDEFCGQTVSLSDQATNGYASLRTPYSGVGPKSTLQTPVAAGLNNITDMDPGFKYIPTTGTILVLDFATVIQLTEEYFAPGSLGQFNLQISVDVVNHQTTTWTKDQYELLIMTMNTGVFVNEKGTSSTFTGLLTKEDVIAASQQQPYTHSEIKRFVGGSFLNGLKSAMGWVSSKLPFVKGVLNNIPNQYAQTGAKVLDALGYGKGGPGKLADRLM